jgi:hypothetical protein
LFARIALTAVDGVADDDGFLLAVCAMIERDDIR